MQEYKPGQKLKIELDDGTICDAEISDNGTIIVDCTTEYIHYYEWNY
jgi:hypothetical protein